MKKRNAFQPARTAIKHLKLGLSLLLLLFASAAGATDPVYTSHFSNKAVGGYDAVSYFTENKPVEGSSQFQYQYKGADWYFSRQENLDAFVANPEKYAPQFGGYCAWAVSQGQTSRGDPKQWDIVDGKLYLNYNAQVKSRWSENKEALIKAGNKYWPEILK